jgi:hypothetical protein
VDELNHQVGEDLVASVSLAVGLKALYSSAKKLTLHAAKELSDLSSDLAKDITKYSKLGYEVVEEEGRYFAKKGNEVFEIGGSASKVGIFTAKQIDEYVRLATKNPNSKKVMLGKYIENDPTSYHIRANNEGYTYFQLDDWQTIYNNVGNNYEEMWKINKQFIDSQIDANKIFYFSHNPSTVNTQGMIREINYLKEKGFTKIIQIEDDLWKIEK